MKNPCRGGPPWPPCVTLAAVVVALLLTVIACDRAPVDSEPAADPPAVAPPAAPPEHWQCRNDLEVTCAEGACEAATEGDFTPMSVDFDDSGTISACAYSGCWEGTGEVVSSGDFLVVIGHDLPFSTARDSESAGADVVVALDREDRVATLKAEGFAQPLLCERR